MTETIARWRNAEGTAAEWTSANPVLASSEMGRETDTGKIKYGDGVTAWNSLAYFTGGGAGSGDVTGPASAVDEQIAVFDGTTGKAIKDGGITVASLATDAEVSSAISTHAALTETHGISAFGATLVDDADASAARTTLGLGTAATTAASDYATAAQGALAVSAVQPAALASYQLLSAKGVAGGYASLDGSGQIPAAQIPSIAITEYLGDATDQTAMLALTGQKGDWCTRTDTGAVWIITADDPSDLADWTQVTYPASPVTSVAGKTGVVTIASADISDATAAGQALMTAADSAAQRTALGLGTAATTAASAYAAASHASSHQSGGGDQIAELVAQSQATWEAGVGTTESVISPAKVAAAIAALGGSGEPYATSRYTGQTSKPSAASSGEGKFHLRRFAGILVNALRGASNSHIQMPSNDVFTSGWYFYNSGILQSYNGSAVTASGNSISTCLDGYAGAINFATAASANAFAGWYYGSAHVGEASTIGGGFTVWGLVYLPDASYGSGSTGVKIQLGAGLAGAVSANGNRLDRIGAILEYNTNQSDTNWQLVVNDGSANTNDTGLAFTAQHHYLYAITVPPGGGNTYAEIWDLDSGTSGYATYAGSPGGALRPECFIVTLGATARNFRAQFGYIKRGGQV